jgi:hypothetical protein
VRLHGKDEQSEHRLQLHCFAKAGADHDAQLKLDKMKRATQIAIPEAVDFSKANVKPLAINGLRSMKEMK